MLESVLNRASIAPGGEEVALAPLLLESVVKRVNAATAAVLTEHGLSVEQWRVLDFLVRQDETPMTELAGAVLSPAPTVTRIVDKLVSRALVYRSSSANDRRRVLVHASQRGKDLHTRLAPQVTNVHMSAFEVFTREQQMEFFNLLRLLNS